MRRRLFTFAAAVSLLLCVGVVVLWVRSYHTVVAVYQGTSNSATYGLLLSGGDAYVRWISSDIGRRPRSIASQYTVLGCRCKSTRRRGLQESLMISAPLAYFAAGFSLPAGFLTFRGWQQRRRPPSLRSLVCDCGYDLRSSPNRCPECGAAVVRSAPASPPTD